MDTKLSILYDFLQSVWPKAEARVGKPYQYSWVSIVLFFLVMFLKRIHSFQAMARYAQVHYRRFGWCQAPSRKTLARRFQGLPSVVYRLMPLVAQGVEKLDQHVFSFRWAFIDKSVFRSKGGIWHQKHRLQGIVPHSSIDTDASWAKSAYHGWRFGYGLHLVCNQFRFPIACSVSTAAQKDSTQLVPLLVHFVERLGVVVADAGYLALKLIQQISLTWRVFVLLPRGFVTKHLSSWQQEYNLLAKTPQARWLYRLRKPSVEPVFALIKEVFQLSGENQLPYQGLPKVKPYLMMTTLTIQLMMYYNFFHRQKLANTQLFLTDFK